MRFAQPPPALSVGNERVRDAAALAVADQGKLCTKCCLNDRLNCVEGRTQGTLDVEPVGKESR